MDKKSAMSKNIIYSGLTHVAIQGDAVLRILEITPKAATYELIGFESYPVVIEDYRQLSIKSVTKALQNNQLNNFVSGFNQPAYATITREDNGRINISLKETKIANPDRMLWIAIGIKDELPKYSFVFCELIPYKGEYKALLSLYRRPTEELPITVCHPNSQSDNLYGGILEIDFQAQ
jgi:hypothetical protein